jgi:transposase-like protein
MKQGEFSKERIIGLLQEAEKGEKTIGSLCREAGIAEPTFYRWRRRLSRSGRWTSSSMPWEGARRSRS